MKIELFQKVRLKNNKSGCIIEVFNDGEAFMVDIADEDGEYEYETIYPKDIKSVFVETEMPFTATA